MAKKKVILFGGTFDPIHLGHTTVASAAVERIGAEKIIFIPAKRSPLKSFFPETSGDDRLRMIALAIAENKKFDVSGYELKKAEPGYTLETVRHFRAEFGSDTSIYWLAGADCIRELPLWYGIVELIDECNLCLMHRAGWQLPEFAGFEAFCGPERVEKLRKNVIQTPLVDISSTEIRRRLGAGLDVTDMLHRPVADYVRSHNLYR